MKLTVQKGTGVSIHEQLVTQISMQIAGGLLPAGTRLPSVRKLSRQLDIHYNTCLAAYRELENRGFITIRQGSGVTVADLTPDDALKVAQHLELGQMCKYFVQLVRRKGYHWPHVQQALEMARSQYGDQARPVVFADVHPDILPLFKAELEDALGCPVQTVLLEAFRSGDFPENTLYLTSRYHINVLRDALGSEENILVIDVASGQQELEAIRQLPNGELLVVVSASTIILQQAEAVVSALRGDELLIRTVLSSEGEDEIRQAVRYGQLIFADTLTLPVVSASTRKPVYPLRVVPESELPRIRAALQA